MQHSGAASERGLLLPHDERLVMSTNNLVELTGNLGSDPSVHTDKNGRDFIRFSIATTDSWKDEETGEWKEMDPIWHSIFAFSENAKKYAAFYQKGQRVKVTGSVRYREVHVKGLEYPIHEAAIHARKIEPAPLPTKKSVKDSAMVTEVSGKGVEFAGSDLSSNDEIPF